MIRTITLITCFSSLYFIGLSQLQPLRKAQDQRKEYIDPSRKPIVNRSPSLYVDPFIGTGGHGHTYPGATTPFGMIQLSPDTRHDGWDGCSGYHYSDSIIYGFSHTHLSGTGVPDYNDLLIVPQTGKPSIEPGYLSELGYGSSFSHEKEIAKPGRYEVELDGGAMYARVGVTERAGMHEYTFNEEAGKKFILLDLDHRDKLLDAGFNIHDKQTISGYRSSTAWANKQQFFFHLTFDQPYQKARVVKKKRKNKLLLVFPKTTKKIIIRIGVSAVDEEGAKKNLDEELPKEVSFNMMVAKTTRQWDNELSRIYISTRDKSVRTIFYTALYHSFIAPNIFSDVDGRYRSRDGEVHQLNPDEWTNYTVFSLWDTYRATHPLFTLVQQKRTIDFISTMLRQYDEGGDLPVWELAGCETECMIGYHSVSVIADAFIKGISGYDSGKTEEAIIATSNFDEFGKLHFADKGFIATGDEPESVSKTLEYSYDDYCIARFLEKNASAPNLLSEYEHRAMNFVNLYDPQTKFMRGRRGAMWFSPFDPAEVNFNYTEANSWQYSLYAPHAVGVLSEMMGGKDSLENWLDRLFNTEMKLSGRHQVDITGLIGQYAHGNEPSHHMAYLYNYTNAPYKTQHYVDRILNEMYTDQPDGLSGNEDCGQMSSWYVLSALGLYPITPGNPWYEVGRPIVDNAVINLENGKYFTLYAKNNSPENKYVEKVVLNGKELNRSYIYHEEIVKGGKLELHMTSDKKKAKQTLHAPTLSELPVGFAPVPFAKTESRVFEDSLLIDMGVVFADDYTIHYTIDGSDPNEKSQQFEKAFFIDKNTTVKLIAIGNEGKSSVVSSDFLLKDTSIGIELHSEYANQYAAAGKFTLIDGIVGGNEYRTGDWQGYWAQDLIAEISFDSPRSLSEIGIGMLSDMKSWIFLPKEVQFEVSIDGESFTKVGTYKQEVETENQMAPHRVLMSTKIDTNLEVKKVRITAVNHGKCPEWHLGNGNDTWLFADEILLK